MAGFEHNINNTAKFPTISLERILTLAKTCHMEYERRERCNKVLEVIASATTPDYVDQCFVVDKGHVDGKEIHCVTHNGIIFVLNLDKYMANRPCLITIKFARPTQVIKLYSVCGLWVDQHTLDECQKYKELELNNI